MDEVRALDGCHRSGQGYGGLGMPEASPDQKARSQNDKYRNPQEDGGFPALRLLRNKEWRRRFNPLGRRRFQKFLQDTAFNLGGG